MGTLVSYYAHRVAQAVIKAAKLKTENCDTMHGSRGQFEAESLFYSMCRVASHPSCLRVVCYYFPRPPTLYTVSAISRHSRLDDSATESVPWVG